MIVKVHKTDGRIIVAVCDDELAGCRFEDGEKQLDLTVDFFKGEKLDVEQAGDLLRNADVVNLVGKKSTELALEEGVIDKNNIVVIAGIPTAQAVVLHE